ncbi:amino acid ABC transporter permease [Cyanobium sp. Cruz CV13-4-11]|jgi:general L-amino acid transport system permease protein|uniref:amino acid ABC transporter permease n=1 Tax=unclassified Cyanobium TaxID=2627006 RepID=UPI0020CDC693|nr:MULTISPECIES: amino acid ABC transporter permease [unclassified Cyanobium]MCP9899268.1 amino acid ABC transporter permease [Cyanobium sp. Cruz CV11-17]MCP9917987.1 amino acid ABC transporter permease [Cyanobium sp. Cruz CV13-4-11]
MNSLLRRLRAELFATRTDTVLSLALITMLSLGAFGVLRWALTQAQWTVVKVNSTLFAVGRYPVEQQWRLWLLTALLVAASGATWGLLRAHPRPDRTGVLWPRNDRLAVGLLGLIALAVPWALELSLAIASRWWGLAVLLVLCRWLAGRFGPGLSPTGRRLAALVWPLLYLVGMVLISGGLGLVSVSPSEWGGLMLTLLASSFAILLCFPIGVLLALGRRSDLPLLRWGSVLYIEFIRGAPLITLLFLGQNILGFLLPGGLAPDRVWRAAWVLTFFAAAYLAEAVRSGLAAVPRGQLEAARSLGLSYPKALQHVVLPQALRVALPAMVGQFISLLQDTTLLSLIGLLELLGTARTVMANPAFLGRNGEVYLTLAVLFWGCCAALGLGSRALERRLDPHAVPSAT